jgi:hypothetical protein
MRALWQIQSALEQKQTQIDLLYVQHISPEIREYNRLKAALRQIAIAQNDEHLQAWLEKDLGDVNAERDEVNRELWEMEKRDQEIRQKSGRSDAEVLADWEQQDKIADLITLRMEQHIKFLRERNARLRAKLAEVGTTGKPQ